MLILLDIDGVMVPATSWRRPEMLQDGFSAFSSKATQALEKILSETQAKIILTSSHKSNYSEAEWLNIFNRRGIKITSIATLPHNSKFLNRREELIEWFDPNSVDESFVIIDDDKLLNDLPRYLKERLVLTNGSVGLTNELAINAIAILNNQKRPLLV